MKRIRNLLLCVMIMLSFVYCHNAQHSVDNQNDKKTEVTPLIIIDSFFTQLETIGFEKAFYNLFESNRNASYDRIELLNVVTLFNEVTNFSGNYCGYELICGSWIGNSLKLYSYMVKYETQPIKFTFIFYKCKDEWFIQNFDLNTHLVQELKDLGKYYTTKGELTFNE